MFEYCVGPRPLALYTLFVRSLSRFRSVGGPRRRVGGRRRRVSGKNAAIAIAGTCAVLAGCQGDKDGDVYSVTTKPATAPDFVAASAPAAEWSSAPAVNRAHKQGRLRLARLCTKPQASLTMPRLQLAHSTLSAGAKARPGAWAMEVPAFEATPIPAVYAPPKLRPYHGLLANGPLKSFHMALADLEQGVRKRPVTILHFGDSHIAYDNLSDEIRHLMQRRFGNAGRGVVMPAGGLKYMAVKGVKLSKSAGWSRKNSRLKRGKYGMSGVNVTASAPGATLTLTQPKTPFDWAEVALLTGPGKGSAKISVGSTSRTVNTRASEYGVKYVRIAHAGSKLTVRPAGGGSITVMYWAVGQAKPGVQYINLGIGGITADALRRWSDKLLAADLAHWRPDLIVLAYGTNESLDDRLNLTRYEPRYRELVKRFKRFAPNASLMVMGPVDVQRGPRARALRRSASCRPLSAGELAKYRRPNRWHEPPNHRRLRGIYRRIAKEFGADYFDWASFMGGDCAMHKWWKSRPQLGQGDHIHLTKAGYDRTARGLYQHLLKDYATTGLVASR